jgi:hypothetical protein
VKDGYPGDHRRQGAGEYSGALVEEVGLQPEQVQVQRRELQ